MRDLLATLRTRDVEQVEWSIHAESGLQHRPVANGQTVSGIYTRTVNLASGRFAMLEDGLRFSLVPWRPLLEKRLGQSMTALVRSDYVSWDFGRKNGIEL
jgi:hypothetical protein